MTGAMSPAHCDALEDSEHAGFHNCLQSLNVIQHPRTTLANDGKPVVALQAAVNHLEIVCPEEHIGHGVKLRGSNEVCLGRASTREITAHLRVRVELLFDNGLTIFHDVPFAMIDTRWMNHGVLREKLDKRETNGYMFTFSFEVLNILPTLIAYLGCDAMAMRAANRGRDSPLTFSSGGTCSDA